MKKNEKIRENLDRLNRSFLVDFISKEEEIEYKNMINLLYKYNELIQTFNISVAGENIVLDNIETIRKEREILRDREDQFIARLQAKENDVKEGLEKIQTRISTIDIYNIEEMKALSTLMLPLEEQAKQVAQVKKVLELIRTEKNVMLEKHNSYFSTFSVYENRLYTIQREIEMLIQQIKEKILYLESRNKEKIAREKETYLEEIFNNAQKSTLRRFNGISSEISGKMVKKYLDLLYSYSELRNSILMQALSVAKDIVGNYRKRPIKLEKNIEIDLFGYEIEKQLKIVEASICQLAMLPLTNQKLKALEIIYDMELLIEQNALYVQIIRGENVEESLEKLHWLYNKELDCKNIARLYRIVSDSQSFSFRTYGEKKMRVSQLENKQKIYTKNGS